MINIALAISHLVDNAHVQIQIQSSQNEGRHIREFDDMHGIKITAPFQISSFVSA